MHAKLIEREVFVGTISPILATQSIVYEKNREIMFLEGKRGDKKANARAQLTTPHRGDTANNFYFILHVMRVLHASISPDDGVVLP